MELTKIQRQLLRQAGRLAGRETRIIYATCSLECEENEEQVKALCAGGGQWRVKQETFTLPDQDRDGGYAAVLVRDG